MRRCLTLLTLLVVPVLLIGDEKKDEKKTPAPNTLTKEEVAIGWLLLFDGETKIGWKIDGEAKVEKGVLILGGEKETTAAPTVHFPGYAYRFESMWTGKSVPIKKVGPLNQSLPVNPDTAGKFAWNWGSAGGGGGIVPFSFTVPAGSTLHLRSVKVIPTLGTGRMNAEVTIVKDQGFTYLDNEKDLTGWKVFKGDPKREKSTYSITNEGWLNVKDGPGDIQTEKTFDDFVLQLECISNGKHLNSGIFFRAVPGEYWMGYEAQIRNEFKDTPQKYTIEEFDPKTHKLLGKKDITSPAFDYGTGAIYRRMPARKQVSKDNEWFTLTIVARERHIATWVNGIQQVDWTDNRPADDNPRKGYRGKAGAISIQGHDKTTDLSFRNIRIAEMKRDAKK